MSPLAAASQPIHLIAQPCAKARLVKVQPVEVILIAVAAGAALVTLVNLLAR